jgi:hypothetical protein
LPLPMAALGVDLSLPGLEAFVDRAKQPPSLERRRINNQFRTPFGIESSKKDAPCSAQDYITILRLFYATDRQRMPTFL